MGTRANHHDVGAPVLLLRKLFEGPCSGPRNAVLKLPFAVKELHVWVVFEILGVLEWPVHWVPKFIMQTFTFFYRILNSILVSKKNSLGFAIFVHRAQVLKILWTLDLRNTLTTLVLLYFFILLLNPNTWREKCWILWENNRIPDLWNLFLINVIILRWYELFELDLTHVGQIRLTSPQVAQRAHRLTREYWSPTFILWGWCGYFHIRHQIICKLELGDRHLRALLVVSQYDILHLREEVVLTDHWSCCFSKELFSQLLVFENRKASLELTDVDFGIFYII